MYNFYIYRWLFLSLLQVKTSNSAEATCWGAAQTFICSSISWQNNRDVLKVAQRSDPCFLFPLQVSLCSPCPALCGPSVRPCSPSAHARTWTEPKQKQTKWWQRRLMFGRLFVSARQTPSLSLTHRLATANHRGAGGRCQRRTST